MIAAALGVLAGLLLAGLVGLVGAVVRFSTRHRQGETERMTVVAPLPGGIGDVLAALRSSGIVLDASDAVVVSSPSAESFGLVRAGELVHPELLEMGRQVRRDGVIREAELALPRGPLGETSLVVGARAAPLGAAHVLLLVEDLSRAHRVEEIRRDFVANVSHELKTPVGGLALLAEAVLEAHDDPAAVARFARRMQVESTRLTRLVQEIVDLSRIQAADTLRDPQRVDLAGAVREAVDHSRLAAEDKQIQLVVVVDGGGAGHEVWGEHDLLTTAVRNLVGNAIAYSGKHTRVTAKVAHSADLVTVSVTDQGQGIPLGDQERIFERFYRVDGARSRATGGTGLGLAIVKHVCSNHGGEVTVWSEPGHGSTFTMRLPAAGVHPPAAPCPGEGGPALLVAATDPVGSELDTLPHARPDARPIARPNARTEAP